MKQKNNRNQWLMKLLKHTKRFFNAILRVSINQPVISIDDRKDLRSSSVFVRIAVNEMDLNDSEGGYRRKHY